jgi:hypothetical protein
VCIALWFGESVCTLLQCVGRTHGASNKQPFPFQVKLISWLSRACLGKPPLSTENLNQKVDLALARRKLGLGEVSATEAAEALAINTLAPFVLNSRLKPLLTPPRYRSGTAGDEHADEQQGREDEGEGGGGDEGDGAVASYVINVSAMEGKFYRKKTVRTEQLTPHDIKR